MSGSLPFRFDAADHTYTALDTGEQLPHITGLLERAGWIDDEWYTEESRARGTAVHAWTAEYDLGALGTAEDVRTAPETGGDVRGYLLSHVAAVELVWPVFETVEVPLVHPRYRFGGRPDRTGFCFHIRGVIEGKSGAPTKAHAVQTALQAILAAEGSDLPADWWGRFALYWKPNGKFKLIEHTRRQDFDEAYRILKEFATWP